MKRRGRVSLVRECKRLAESMRDIGIAVRSAAKECRESDILASPELIANINMIGGHLKWMVAAKLQTPALKNAEDDDDVNKLYEQYWSSLTPEKRAEQLARLAPEGGSH